MGSEAGWPALGWEENPWVPRIPPELVSAAVRRRHAGPYRAAVVPHIAELTPTLPSEVLTATDEASVEIARFDADLGSQVAPFAAVLLRSESASSSMIENLSSGAKAIALAELGSRDKRNATEIVGNVAAMRAALDLANHLDGQAIIAMQRALLGEVAPELTGQWRSEQVWIGGSTFGPHLASFVPPDPRYVPDLMDDLVRFIQRTDIPLLVQAAIAHAQFETIHPFPDGNGRTGRALVHAMLRSRGLTSNITVPVSAGLLTDTAAYFDALTAYRAGDAVSIARTFATAALTAIANGRQLAADIREIREGWASRITARGDARAWQVADLLLRQPVIDSATVAAELQIALRNAPRAIAPLVGAGILTEFTGFKRNRMWQANEILAALDDFADRCWGSPPDALVHARVPEET